MERYQKMNSHNVNSHNVKSKEKNMDKKNMENSSAPKRSKSSYIFFCIDNREKIKKANPNMSAKELIRELGRVWREEVSPKKKAKYEKLAQKDKDRYNEEMSTYTPPPSSEKPKKRNKKQGPKRARSAYIFFCGDQRDRIKNKYPNMSTTELTSKLGSLWRSLSEKDRKPYNDMALKDKVRYQEEKNNNTESSNQEETIVVKPKKSRKKSGYILFCQENRSVLKSENSDLTNQQITKQLGARWKNLSKEEQLEFNTRASSQQ